MIPDPVFRLIATFALIISTIALVHISATIDKVLYLVAKKHLRGDDK